MRPLCIEISAIMAAYAASACSKSPIPFIPLIPLPIQGPRLFLGRVIPTNGSDIPRPHVYCEEPLPSSPAANAAMSCCEICSCMLAIESLKPFLFRWACDVRPLSHSGVGGGVERLASGFLRFLVGGVPKSEEREEDWGGGGAALRFFRLEAEFVALVGLSLAAAAGFLRAAGLRVGAFVVLSAALLGGMAGVWVRTRIGWLC